MSNKHFKFEELKLQHFFNQNVIGSFNEAEHFALINFIKYTKIDSYSFLDKKNNVIRINSLGEYDKEFNGYKTMENILTDRFNINENNTDLLILNYNLKSYSSFNFINIEDLKIGDVVRISDIGYQYSTYHAAFKFHGITSSIDFFDTRKNYTVLKISDNPSMLSQNDILVSIENENGDQGLFNILGLTKI